VNYIFYLGIDADFLSNGFFIALTNPNRVVSRSQIKYVNLLLFDEKFNIISTKEKFHFPTNKFYKPILDSKKSIISLPVQNEDGAVDTTYLDFQLITH